MHAAVRLALPLVALLVVAACAKKPVSLTDPALSPPVYPEGRPGNTTLVMYPDTPVPLQLWQDNGDPGESPDDVLLETTQIYESGPGAAVGMIADSTDASQYQVYKHQGDGGYVDLFPNTVKPVRTWPYSHYDAYLFVDPSPFAPPAREYIGRGVVDGLVTTDAPLTNVSDMSQLNVPGTLRYLGRVFPDTTMDSLVFLKWQAVPGAAGYWISMYGFPPAFLPQSGLLHNALPHPILTEHLPEYFVAYIPAPTTSYKLGDPLPTGGRLLNYGRIIVTQNSYAVRIVAVDGNGQMLDFTGSTGAFVVQGIAPGLYYRFPLDAVLVFPVPVPPIPGAERRAGPDRLARPLAPGETRLSRFSGPRS
jgi:hypothetical protein